MGAALIPQMHQRENMVMDTAQAGLQETLGRTANAADQNRRLNEMQPYDIAQKKATTEGDTLNNRAKNNDLGVFDARGGVAGAAKRDDKKDEYEQKKRDFEIFNNGLKGFRDTAGLVKVASIGGKRAVAVETMTRIGMPERVIAAIQNLPEEQIDAKLQEAIDQMNQNAPKFAIQGLKEEGANTRAATAVQGRLDNTALKGQIDLQIAQIKAAASAAKTGAGGAKKDPNLSVLLAGYAEKATAALLAGDADGAQFWINRSRDTMLTYRAKPEKPPAGPKTTTIRNRDGKVIMTETVEQGNGGSTPQTGTNNDGWGTPRMR